MKPRVLRLFPRSLVVCVAPLLACASARAEVINFNEASTTNFWTFPTGTNLLATATPTPATATTHEGSSNLWSKLTDGSLGAADGADPGESVTPANGDMVTFALDIAAQPAGYNITSFDSYCAWANSGRDNQNFTFQYSTVEAPDTFNTIAVVRNQTGVSDSTHTSLTDTTGFLAMGVHSVRLIFNGQENGYTGFRELILRAEPTWINVLNESNTTNVWTLPAGINLLNGSTATPAPQQSVHGDDIASSTWATVTDNSVGIASDFLASVTPNNLNIVTFPLDTSVNFNGYNLTSFDSYAAWSNSGRDNQDFSIRYSTVDAPEVFIPLAAVDNNTSNPNLATHTRLTPSFGFLATRVAAVQLFFNSQENGYAGYREFIALGTAVALADPLTWTGGTNANWITGADNNWKQTVGGAPAVFNALAELTFDITGANRNITIPMELTASSLSFANDNATPYSFGGQLLTVSNSIASSGTGSATFNNPVLATTGVNLSGAGSLVFNDTLQSPGMTIPGTGRITLNAANPLLTGNVSVSGGTLNVGNDAAIEVAALNMTGGTANFTTGAPVVKSLAGNTGTIVLGDTSSPVATSLFVGDGSAATSTSFGGNISQAAGDTGSLIKAGLSSLSLSGTNTYGGPTSVFGGTLEFGQEVSLYGGLTGSWTAANIQVDSGATLGFKVGSAGEFSDSALTALDLGGFQANSTLGIDTTADFTFTRNIAAPVGLLKKGPAVLTLTGANSYSGLTHVVAGTLNAANPGGPTLPGNVLVGDGSSDATLNFGADNQFGAGSVLTLSTGPSLPQGKVNLRGTSQTVAGLVSSDTNRISLIQNDEIGQPGYTVDPGPASLMINATSDHSFRGIIRDQDGGPVSVIKNGPGTQEFRNSPAAAYGYTGPTTINEGILRINFAGAASGFGSNITVENGARLEFNAVGGDYFFDRELHGPGQIAATGVNALRFTNPANSFTGGLTIGSPGIETYNGFVALVAQNGVVQGAGNGPGQTSIGGAMTPTNVITVQGGATLALDGIGPLGESSVVPEFAPSVVINHSGLRGGGLAFVANLTLNNAEVTVGNGIVIGGFDTSLAFVGTVTVGGDSNFPSTIETPVAGPSANVSLGSAGLPGTVFDVADVTSSSASDLVVEAILRNVNSEPSPLTKTGPGTMELQLETSYTGKTHVMEGELRLNTASLAESSDVEVDAAGTLNLQFDSVNTIRSLTLAGVEFTTGTFGSTTNMTPNIIQTPRITGPGMLLVSANPVVSYETWSLAIPNAADRDREDDSDGDGLTNLEEFLFGTSPNESTATLSTVEDTGSTLIIRWCERLDSDSVYVLQESTTLENPWPTSGVTPTIDADQSGLYSEDYVRMQAVIPIDIARKFARVFATE